MISCCSHFDGHALPTFSFSSLYVCFVICLRLHLSSLHVFISDHVSHACVFGGNHDASMRVLRCALWYVGLCLSLPLSFCLISLVFYLICHLSQNLNTQKELAINCECRQHLQWVVSHECCGLCCVLASDRQGLSRKIGRKRKDRPDRLRYCVKLTVIKTAS